MTDIRVKAHTQRHSRRPVDSPECREEIYIRFPGQYSLPDGKVLCLRKMLYGLKNSAFVWNEHFTKWMKDHGFTNVDGDGVTFVKIENKRNGSINKMENWNGIWVQDYSGHGKGHSDYQSRKIR